MVLVQYVPPEESISPGQESPCNRIRRSIGIVVAYRTSADNGLWHEASDRAAIIMSSREG